ncbi:Pentatricopeptide repeat [Trema orientale]|uniref:Pentatricopeptide repeat n=1 Tax=Trema orientale TaxID=63057 RepID=A0A2P5E8S0_TREOI|nr:Pentatricopeptide repeat [Trema orientale]
MLQECRQIDQALLIFDQTKGLKCEPDLITYNIVLDILGRVGHVVKMLHEFSSMKEAGISPEVISYNTLLNSLKKEMLRNH